MTESDKNDLINMKNSADGFRLVSEKLDVLDTKEVFPKIVNASFSCELYIKIILKILNTSFNRNHKLKDLFELLPIDLQDDVRKKYNSIPNRNLNFDEELSRSTEAFVNWRYIYEQPMQEIKPQFLIDFSKFLFLAAEDKMIGIV